jgi:hypothetical protein
MRGFAIFHHMLDFAQNFIDAYHNLQKQCLDMLPERFVKHLKPEATSHTFDTMTENGAQYRLRHHRDYSVDRVVERCYIGLAVHAWRVG